MGCFLKEIFDRVRKIEEADYSVLSNYLEIIGYELTREHIEDDYDYDSYKKYMGKTIFKKISRKKERRFPDECNCDMILAV